MTIRRSWTVTDRCLMMYLPRITRKLLVMPLGISRRQTGRTLAGCLQVRHKAGGSTFPGLTPAQGQGFGNLDWLSNITGQLHQQPGLLREILGGLTGSRQSSSSGGSIFSNPLAKAAMAGITAMVVKKVLGGRQVIPKTGGSASSLARRDGSSSFAAGGGDVSPRNSKRR